MSVMPAQRDYYDVLGVSRHATAEEIKRAYRTLARELHPDVNKSADAPEKFNEVQQAYDVLSDDAKRKSYDRFGHAGAQASAGGRPSGTYSWSNVGGGSPGTGFSDADVASMFDEIFGGGRGPFAGAGGPAGHARARSKPRRGGDLHRSITVSFVDAIRGTTETVRVQRGGSTQTFDVRIPPATSDGNKLRVRGAGQPSQSGGSPGDLILTVEVGGHPYFKREHNDVLIDLPVTIAEATLGTKVTVPTLDGKVDLRVPPGTSSGAKLRIKGRGVRDPNGNEGDFYAVVKIVPPKDLDDETRAAIESLAECLPDVRTGDHWK